jgi:23S rRNA (uracil1939-C5)-methyltransferase
VPSEKSPTSLNQAKLSTLDKNSEINVPIASLSHGGSGVGRVDNFVVFTPYTAPGDVAKVKLLSLKKNYAEAELVSIETPSPHRIKPPCSVFGQCGGCQWQHVSYQEQLKQKQLIVEHSLNRIAHESHIEILPIIPSPQEFNYRNRAQFRAEGPRVGFYQKRSHNIVEFDECLIVDKKINQELQTLKKERANVHPEKTAKIEVFLTPEGKLVRSLNRAHGEELGFSQVNTLQNQKMLDYVAELLNSTTPGELLDLYCGSGNFSLWLNKKGWKIFGIDNNRQAIEAARKSGQENTFFAMDDCSVGAKKLASKNRKFEAILIDPPRVGADEKIWSAIAQLKAPKLIYVSCNPATFARDWARIRGLAPYTLKCIQPFDMFPQTFHVELVAFAELQN